MKPICSAECCDKISWSMGYCRPHYQKFRVHPLYNTWTSMKNRCYSTNSPQYHNYGGRGIKVCDEWKNNFRAFSKYMGKKPSQKHSIDRIDNDGNYEPGNVKWSLPIEQIHNQQIKNPYGLPHIRLIIDKSGNNRWKVIIGTNGRSIYVGVYDNLEESLSARLGAESEYHYGF